MVGASVKVSPRTGSTSAAAIQYREESLWGSTPSRRFDLQREYYHWNSWSSFPDNAASSAQTHGRTLVMSIKLANTTGGVIKYTSVTQGAQDAVIDHWITVIKAFGGAPVYLCFNHEADAQDKKINASSSTLSVVQSEFKAAVRYIVNRMRAGGVTRSYAYMGYILTMGGFSNNTEADAWYPGDAYMDWIGVDGYNWYPCRPGSNWREFQEVFATFLPWGKARKAAAGKQLLVCETACQERDGFDARSGHYECSGFSGQSSSAKASWITNMRNALKGAGGYTDYSAIDGVCYYDSDIAYNWWLDTRPGSLSAFAAMGNDAYFGGGATPPPAGVVDLDGVAFPLEIGHSALSTSGTITPDGVAFPLVIGRSSLSDPLLPVPEELGLWRVAIFDLDGTERIHDLPVGDFSFTQVLNAPGSFEADVSMHNVSRDDVEPGRSDYRVYYSGILRAAGRIWTIRVDTGADKLEATLVGEGYWSILRRRLIDGEVRYEPTSESPPNLNTLYGLAQEEIAWDLINRSQLEDGGDVGLSQGLHIGPSIPRRRWYCEEDGTAIADAIDEFANLHRGLDYAITPTLTDDSIKTFRTWSPSQGNDLGITVDGTQYLDTLTYEIDAHDIVTRAKALPQGDCDPELADVTDPDSLATYGLLEDFTDVDTDDPADAVEAADEMLAERDHIVLEDAIEYFLPEGPDIGTFDLGDTFEITSPRAGWELATTVRITEVQVTAQMPENTFVRIGFASL